MNLLPIIFPIAVWSWPITERTSDLAVNYGVRADEYGEGWFGASRGGGSRMHNGIDLLASMHSPVIAICDGIYKTGNKEPYGRYAQLVCEVPGVEHLYVSVLYAHLSGDFWCDEHPEYANNETCIAANQFVEINQGDIIGAVGKSGNANDPKIASHLHIEMDVHGSIKEAMLDTHPLANEDIDDVDDAPKYLEEVLTDKCLQPFDIQTSGIVRSGYRFDPYLMLACFSRLPKTEMPDILQPFNDTLDLYARPFSMNYFSLVVDIDNVKILF